MHRYLGIVGGALMAFILATGLIMGTTFAYFADVQRQQLKTETEMAALAVDEAIWKSCLRKTIV